MKMPDICKNSSILTIIVYAELGAIFLSLFKRDDWSLSLLGVYSFYILWIALGTAALICLIDKRFKVQNGVLLFCAACLTTFLVVEGFIWFVKADSFVGIEGTHTFIQRFFLLLIAGFFLVRIFQLMDVLEQRNAAESQSRMQALQSRIRPHFLFNSLNTISELTNKSPKQAEQAINSLAMLFRASLENEQRSHSLEGEINLCKQYLELESWRLAERLNVEWSLEIHNLANHQVPKLILQPLIENAVLHGVQDDGNIEIKIDVRESKENISIVIENTKGSGSALNQGNGIAIDNIRERLFGVYDDKHTFKIRESDTTYRVLIRFPKQPVGFRK